MAISTSRITRPLPSVNNRSAPLIWHHFPPFFSGERSASSSLSSGQFRDTRKWGANKKSWIKRNNKKGNMELRSRKFHPSPTTEVEVGHRCPHRDTDRMDVEVPQADTRTECRHPQQVCSIFNSYPGLMACGKFRGIYFRLFFWTFAQKLKV